MPGRISSWILSGLLLLGGAGPLSAQGAEAMVIRSLDFQGNRAIADEVLATWIGTTNSDFLARTPGLRSFGLGTRRYFNADQFRRDIYDLTVFYRASGYDAVTIDTTVQRNPDHVAIEIRVVEGEPTIVRGMQVDGADQVGDRYRVVRDLPVARGDVFNRFLANATRDSLTQRLRARGYPAARTEWSWVPDPADAKRVTVKFLMTTGPRATFGPIQVTGFQQVDSTFIVSLLTVRSGQPYREEELIRSERALNASELFSYTTLTIDTAAYSASDSTLVPLRIDVVEGKMHTTTLSAGYATSDCLRAGAEWTARNFLGGGRVFSLNGQVSKIGVGSPLGFGLCPGLYRNDPIGSRKANFSVEPSIRRNGFLSPDNRLTLTTFARRRSEYTVYSREEVGATIDLTRETWSRVPVSLSYQVTYGQTNANPAAFCGYFNSCTAADIDRLRQARFLAVATLGISKVRLNSPLDPTRGLSLSAQFSLASPWIGSSRDRQFARVVGEAAGYLPLSRSTVLALRARAGAIMSPTLALADGRENFVPPEMRFYAGGPNDVRGFDRNELGPLVYVVPPEAVDHSTTPASFDPAAARISAIGGDRVANFNAEVRLPSPILPGFLRTAAFVDVGMLRSKGLSAPVRVTPGVGVRVVLPRFAPVRLDLAYNRYPSQSGSVYTTTPTGDLQLLREGFARARSSRWTFHFAFGQAF